MSLWDFFGLAVIGFCAFEVYSTVTNEETTIPFGALGFSKAEQPVGYWVSLCGWCGFLIASIAIVWGRL